VVGAEGEGAQQRLAAQRESIKGAAYEIAALVFLDDSLGGVDVIRRGAVETEVGFDDFTTRATQKSQRLVAGRCGQPPADSSRFAQPGQRFDKAQPDGLCDVGGVCLAQPVAAGDVPDEAGVAIHEGVPGALVACTGRAYQVSHIDVDNDLPPRAGNGFDQLLRTIVGLTRGCGAGWRGQGTAGPERRGPLQAAGPASWGLMSILRFLVVWCSSWAIR
jgi:hypothetical protein